MKRKGEKKVEKMLEEWDIVTCNRCGKKISMLNAQLDKAQEHFYCKEHPEN
jgi:hypothetical protein